MKNKHAAIVCFFAGLLIIVVFAQQVSRPRVIARAVAPNGIEFCLVQRLGEPFATSAYYRKPGGPWGWFYYDHEDSLWMGGRVEIDEEQKLIKVYRADSLTATFAWEQEVFTLKRMNRTMTGAQTWLPSGKSPWD